MDLNEHQAWLALLNAPGLGNTRLLKLMQHCGSAVAAVALKSPPDSIQIPTKAWRHVQAFDPSACARELAWLEKPGNHLLTVCDPLYPPLLKNTPDPPAALFLKGDPAVLLMPQLAVVGSRNATPGGLQNTQRFCRQLAAGGLVITSGLAQGIDTQAHQAALDAGGRSVAVMGTGINSIYPKSNVSLAKRLVEHGAVVSELPFDAPPASQHFPRRNRIISGLALGTLVVESGLRSGSLITARLSMEINRPVMAIPGAINNPMARGNHRLIREGARLVECADEVLEELQPMAAHLSEQLQMDLQSALANENIEKPDSVPTSDLSDDQRQVLAQIGHQPMASEEIIQASGLTTQAVSSILLILELKNKIQKLPGARYQKL